MIKLSYVTVIVLGLVLPFLLHAMYRIAMTNV